MSRYLQGAGLHAACAAGKGAIVFVEGETEQDDAFYFSRWFADRATEISFFAQNGWKKVEAAVQEMRGLLPGRRVFGIVDRDFAQAGVLAAQAAAVPANGVFRLQRYTIENYLLDPIGWREVVTAINGAPQPNWSTTAEVEAQIKASYDACVSLGAWNHVVHHENFRNPNANSQSYREHPAGVPAGSDQVLAAWGQGRGAPAPLDVAFNTHIQMLQGLPGVSDLAEWVTGKAVLKVLLTRMPVPGSRPNKDVLVNLYFRFHAAAAVPPELTTLVQRVIL